MLGEAVRLVTDILQQPQRRGMAAQPQRLAPVRLVNLLFALGQRDQAGRLTTEHAKDLQGGAELALAAVDEQDIRKNLLLAVEPVKAPRYHFTNRGEVVHAGYGADAKTAVTRLEGQAVNERHERGHRL